MGNQSFSTKEIKEKFQDPSAGKFESISSEMFNVNQNSVQNFKNLCSVEKDNLYTWLALGKSYEEGLDPRNSIVVINSMLVFMLTFLTTTILVNVVPESIQSIVSIVCFVLILITFVIVCVMTGNLINKRMRVVQLNTLIESAIEFNKDNK
ncbi:hypothetical protein [Priestia megaterium]|uniref:hypothetical protein n=1 Tax=Priestia megaterium TaxID=1404 RepID=UPI000BFD113A|nr:hypothetical protein [Priestia megaterium]PGR79743.1 hypothetical protein COC53_26480 [Priestia megaterium]